MKDFKIIFKIQILLEKSTRHNSITIIIIKITQIFLIILLIIVAIIMRMARRELKLTRKIILIIRSMDLV